MNAAALFATWPYVAAALFLAGMIVRVLLAAPQQEGPIIPGGKPGSHSARILWYFAVVLLVLLHLIQFVFPNSIAAWDGVSLRLYLLEALAFCIGLVVLGGCIHLALRMFREGSTSRLLGDGADAAFLSLVLTSIVSGVLMAAVYRWSTWWATTTLTPYLRSLLQSQPKIAFVAALPFLPRLHVLSGFGALGLFPATRWAGRLCVAGRKVVAINCAPAASRISRRVATARLYLQVRTITLLMLSDEEEQ